VDGSAQASRTADDRPDAGPTDGGTLWLARHGESTWNALGLVQGQVAEPALTRRGLGQAEKVAKTLAAGLAGTEVRGLYSSDLRRAVQTARPLGALLGRDAVADPRLRERSFGEAEGIPSRLLSAGDSGIDGERVIDADASPTGGESVRGLYYRAAAFVESLVIGPAGEAAGSGGAGDVVLVVHGGVVRVLAAWLDGVSPEEMHWGPVGNGLVTSRPLATARRLAMSGT
jgi:probable phosphoglycerate mutase